MKKRRFNWNIFNDGKYIVVELNGGVNSMIPIQSEKLEQFKEEKLEEIQFFSTITKSTINGLELLQ